MKGRRTRDVFAGFGFTDDAQLGMLSAAKQSAYFRSIAREGLPLIPGARRLLDFLHARNIHMYIVSAGSRTSVEEAICEPRESRLISRVSLLPTKLRTASRIPKFTVSVSTCMA